jgi:hypothetical protein
MLLQFQAEQPLPGRVQFLDQLRERAAMQIRGIEGRSFADVEAELQAGSRFVFFEYCISLVFVTLRRPSAIVLLRPGELGLARGLPYTLVSLLLGWWGLPWGLVYTPVVLFTNLSGGRDVTAAVRAYLQSS